MSIIGFWLIAGLTLSKECEDSCRELLGEKDTEPKFDDVASKSSVFRFLCRRVSEEKKSRGDLPRRIVDKFNDLASRLREIYENCRELDSALAELAESFSENRKLECLIEFLDKLTSIVGEYSLHKFKWNRVFCEKGSVVFDAKLLKLKLDSSGVVRVLSGGDFRVVDGIDVYLSSRIQVIKVSYRHGKRSKVTGAVFCNGKWYSLDTRVLFKPSSLISVQIKPSKGPPLEVKVSVDDVNVKIEGDLASLVYSVSLFVVDKKLLYCDPKSGKLRVLEAFPASSISKSDYLFIPLERNKGLLIDLSKSSEGTLYYAYLKKSGRVQKIPVSECECVSESGKTVVKIKPRERKPVVFSSNLSL